MVVASLRIWAYPERISEYNGTGKRLVCQAGSQELFCPALCKRMFRQQLCDTSDTHDCQDKMLHIYGYIVGDCKSLQKKISAELRGLACVRAAWMAAMAVMKHTSDGR